jgi:ligand-binding SRPBCC domain-containing protein
MKIYSLKRKQNLPVSIQQAWNFFSNPNNLARITPPKMRFKILRNSGTDDVHPGKIIDYNVSILPFVRVYWQTEITFVNAPFEFADEQRIGPYTYWLHKHYFKETETGVEMTDEVFYSIPMGWLGRLANFTFVERQLNAIFEYRRNVLNKIFPQPPAIHTP